MKKLITKTLCAIALTMSHTAFSDVLITEKYGFEGEGNQMPEGHLRVVGRVNLVASKYSIDLQNWSDWVPARGEYFSIGASSSASYIFVGARDNNDREAGCFISGQQNPELFDNAKSIIGNYKRGTLFEAFIDEQGSCYEIGLSSLSVR